MEVHPKLYSTSFKMHTAIYNYIVVGIELLIVENYFF